MLSKITYTCVCFILLCNTAYAQFPDSTRQNDPFQNDPFFTKPVEDLLTFRRGQIFNQDSIQQTYHQLSYSGFDRGYSGGTSVYNAPLIYSMYPLLPANRYNRVDGVAIGFRKDRMRWHATSLLFNNIPSFTPTGFVSRAFERGEWDYGIGLEKYFGRNDRLMIGAEFHDAATTDDYWRAGLNETSLTALFASFDFLDYYKTDGFGAYAALRTKRFFEFGFTYNNDDYESLERDMEFSFFGEDSDFRLNPAVDSTNIESFSFGISANPKNLIMTRSFTAKADLFVELADLGTFNNEFSFNRYELESKFFFRLEKSTRLSIRFKGGSITGEAPVQRLYELGGIGSLRARGYKEFDNANQMLLANTELQFGRFGDYGSGWFNSNNFYVSVFWDAGWTHFENQQLDRNNPFKGFSNFALDDIHNDVGFGFGSNLIRAELAWRTEDFGDSPALWVRFNPTF